MEDNAKKVGIEAYVLKLAPIYNSDLKLPEYTISNHSLGYIVHRNSYLQCTCAHVDQFHNEVKTEPSINDLLDTPPNTVYDLCATLQQC